MIEADTQHKKSGCMVTTRMIGLALIGAWAVFEWARGGVLL